MTNLHSFNQSFELEPSEYSEPEISDAVLIEDRFLFLGGVALYASVGLYLGACARWLVG